MCCKLLTVNHLQCIGVKRVVFCLNQLIGIDAAERPIQDEDNTSKKMIQSSPPPPFVYMIYKPFKTDQIIKIGCTEEPIKRLSDLQTGNENKLDFALVIQVLVGKKYEAEGEVKRYFKNLGLGTKSTLGGGEEWFYTEPIGGVNEAAEKMAEILQGKNLYISDVTSYFRISRDLDKPIRETKRKN